MENLKIHSELISLGEQLEAIKGAREYLIEDASIGFMPGLCAAIRVSIPAGARVRSHMRLFIPLFTRENAIKHCNGEDACYWWLRYLDGKPNLAPRLAMLDWMEGLIKEEIDKQK